MYYRNESKTPYIIISRQMYFKIFWDKRLPAKIIRLCVQLSNAGFMQKIEKALELKSVQKNDHRGIVLFAFLLKTLNRSFNLKMSL